MRRRCRLTNGGTLAAQSPYACTFPARSSGFLRQLCCAIYSPGLPLPSTFPSGSWLSLWGPPTGLACRSACPGRWLTPPQARRG